MKRVKYGLLLCLILTAVSPFFTTRASAEEANAQTEGREVYEELISDYAKILPDGYESLSDAPGVVSYLGFDGLLLEVANAFLGQRGRIVSFLFMLLGVSVLISLCSMIEGEFKETVRCGVSAVCAILIFAELFPLVSEVATTLGGISDFFSLFVPVMCAAVLSGGGITTAGSAAVGMNLTLEICSLFTEGVLMTLVLSMFLSGLVSSFGGGVGFFAKGVKSTFFKGLGLLLAVLMGTISLQTLISASADNIAMRTARYAMANMIPIVGSTVSGALSTLVSGLAYSKGIIGGGGVAVIVSMAIAPLVTLLAYKLCFFIAVGFLEFCGMDEGARCLSAMRDGLDALISVYTLSCVIYILEIVLLLMCEVNF